MNGFLNAGPMGALYGDGMDPKTMGLLQAGLGMMSASGPSRTPTSFGQVLGQGGMQGLQGYAQANKANQEQMLYKLKMSEVEREIAERKKKEAAVAAFKTQYPQFAHLVDISPQLAAQRAFPEPSKPSPYTLAPGQTRFDSDGRVVGSMPDKPSEAKPPTTRKIRVGKEEVSQEYVNGQWREVGRGPAFSDKPLVTVDNKQETEFGKAVGRELGQQYSGLMQADFSAPGNIGKYERLGTLLGSVNTGKFKGATTDLKAAAKSVGFDLSAMGIADDVAPAQAARALANQLALEMRNPAGGAGMPGAMSDKDREFLVQMIPSLENDPQAVSKMVDYRVRLEKRAQQVARKARDYRRKTGKFDEGFFDELQEWSSKNPLFPEAASAPVMPVLSPKAQQYLDAVR